MKTALLFPGQGAQFVGMGKKLYEQEPKARELYERANSILGFNLAKTCFEGPEEELNKTNICQPAILVTSIAAWNVMSAKDEVQWSSSAGLSLGEYTALVAAEALSFDDAVRLVERRGSFMQQDCDRTKSTMASVIGLDRQKIQEVCTAVGGSSKTGLHLHPVRSEHSKVKEDGTNSNSLALDASNGAGIISIANINSPEQIVISGDYDSVMKASELLKQAGARKVIPLKVAGAFHSALMKSAETKLTAELQKVNIKTPLKDVISNVTGDYAKTPEQIRVNLSRQVSNPVLWLDSMQRLIQDGYDNFYEIGPGKVLTGLIKRINDKVTIFNYEV